MASVPVPAAGPTYRRVAAWYAVGLLTATYAVSFLDRQLLALLIAPIRTAFHLDDTQFSLLTGAAFSICFAVSGLPLGRAADLAPRHWIMAGGMLVWSAATGACAFAQSFGALFLARMLVGVGEAALTPAAYALFADAFPRDRLGRAIAVFSIGSLAGAGLSLIGGGALLGWIDSPSAGLPLIRGAHWPWAFVFASLPGIAIVPLILLTLRDGGHERRRGADGLSLRALATHLHARRDFLAWHSLGFTAYAACFFALMAWLPAVVARRHGLSPGAAGLRAGLLVITASPAGALLAGWLTDRSGGAARSAAAGVAAAGAMAMILPGLLILLGPSTALDPALWLALFFAPWPLVTATAALQHRVAPAARAQTTALFLLIVNLLGQTGAVSAVALATSRLWGDPSAIHRGLATVIISGSTLAVVPLLLTRRVDRRLEQAAAS